MELGIPLVAPERHDDFDNHEQRLANARREQHDMDCIVMVIQYDDVVIDSLRGTPPPPPPPAD